MKSRRRPFRSRHMTVVCCAAAFRQLPWHEWALSARLASLIQLNTAAVAVAPLMRKRIGGAQVVARREKEEGSAGAVRDAKLAQRLHHRLHAVMVGRHAHLLQFERPRVR